MPGKWSSCCCFSDLLLSFSRVYLKPGNVIQFISRSSARSIQIVVSKEGSELICDAIGGTGPFFPNAYWLVVCSQHGRYFFHNNYNYLGMKNGKVVILPSSNNEKPPSEAEFRVQDVLGSAQAIYLESVHMPGYFLTFDDDGVPGDETKAKTKDKFAQVEIQLVSRSFSKTRRCWCDFLLSFRSPMDQASSPKRMTRRSKHRMKPRHPPIGQPLRLQAPIPQNQIRQLTLGIVPVPLPLVLKKGKFRFELGRSADNNAFFSISTLCLSIVYYILCAKNIFITNDEMSNKGHLWTIAKTSANREPVSVLSRRQFEVKCRHLALFTFAIGRCCSMDRPMED